MKSSIRNFNNYQRIVFLLLFGSTLLVLMSYVFIRFQNFTFGIISFVLSLWFLIVVLCSYLFPAKELSQILYILILHFWILSVLSFIVSGVYSTEYGALHSYSDDYWYLTVAYDIGGALRDSALDLTNALDVALTHTSNDYSLIGWPLLLGGCAYWIASDFSQMYGVAVVLNVFLSMACLCCFFYVVKLYAKSNYISAYILYIASLIDPMVYACMARKEVFLMLGLTLTAIAGIRMILSHYDKYSFILLIFGSIIIMTTRPAYIMLIVFIFFFSLSHQRRISGLSRFMFLSLSSLLALPIYFSIDIRGKSISEIMSSIHALGSTNILSGSGTSGMIYSIPLIGPIIYYLLAPVPPLNLIDIIYLDNISIIRSIGSILWFCLFAYTLATYTRLKFYNAYQTHKVLAVLVIYFLFLFIGAVIYSDDPRYKQPCSIFLALTSYIIWTDANSSFFNEKKKQFSHFLPN